jgi:hypothetical protein
VLARAAADAGAYVVREPDGSMTVTGLPAEIGELAARHRVVVQELAPQLASLEDAFSHSEAAPPGGSGAERVVVAACSTVPGAATTSGGAGRSARRHPAADVKRGNDF